MLNDQATAVVERKAFAPGSAYWNQRMKIAAGRDRLLTLSRTVGRPEDLTTYQFAQLVATCLEFAPDLVLELGRGLGNSTCAFTEAARMNAPGMRVVSLCNTDAWQTITAPALRNVVDEAWFVPLDALVGDILTFDYAPLFAAARRVLIFWDAHGFDIAECVLGTIVRLIADRDHLVLMHDMSDTRYCAPSLANYGERRLWKGENAGEARLRIGIVDAAVAQAVSVIDFTGRNSVTLDSADHSFDLDLRRHSGRVEHMRELLGEELFSLQGHWFWFTLNERPGPYTFPAVPAAR
jgi:hypothetical protein